MVGLVMLLCWMLMSKFLKLLGHYIRYPVDFLLLPVSILFGYLHGLIKARAMLSLNVVSRHILAVDPLLTYCLLQTAWGTRHGADDDDAYRMIRVIRKHHEFGGLACSSESSPLEGEKF